MSRQDDSLGTVPENPLAPGPGLALGEPQAPSRVRAWFYLIWLSLQRQARLRQMVWISLGLLVLAMILVSVRTATGRWGMADWRAWRRFETTTYEQVVQKTSVATQAVLALGGSQASSLNEAVFQSVNAVLGKTDFIVFSGWVVFSVFLNFLLPLWSLSFATEALGGDRESHSLLWLLTRPLPRWSIYLAKFVALLPWTLAFNLGGFALICLCAGRPGPQALRLYWPAVLCASLAFAALFHLMAAFFRRPGIMAIVYAFFLETIMGNMPGYLKRVSINFYTRCMMYEAAQEYGVQPEKPSVFLPVDGTTALWTLMGVTVGLLVVGMYVFHRKEYVSVV